MIRNHPDHLETPSPSRREFMQAGAAGLATAALATASGRVGPRSERRGHSHAAPRANRANPSP